MGNTPTPFPVKISPLAPPAIRVKTFAALDANKSPVVVSVLVALAAHFKPKAALESPYNEKLFVEIGILACVVDYPEMSPLVVVGANAAAAHAGSVPSLVNTVADAPIPYRARSPELSPRIISPRVVITFAAVFGY